MRRVFAASISLAWLALVAAGTLSVLDSYRDALAALKTPAYMEFSYNITRSGPGRIVTERHQVYWASTGAERNDTVAINGTPVIPAVSQVIHRAAWPYDPSQFLVSADDYDATPAGIAVVEGHKSYAFVLTRNSPADFVMKSLYVDTKRRLPVRQTFAVAGADCDGSGQISFGPVSAYWLPTFVSVICTQSGSAASSPAVFKESIRFSGYQFPATIPADVFESPKSAGSENQSPLGGP